MTLPSPSREFAELEHKSPSRRLREAIAMAEMRNLKPREIRCGSWFLHALVDEALLLFFDPPKAVAADICELQFCGIPVVLDPQMSPDDFMLRIN